jgi:cysteinyl-tRNA synthetase
MDELRVQKPTFEPRSFDYVAEVIDLAKILLEKQAAYEREGNVYFPGATVATAAGLEEAEAIGLAADRGGHPEDPRKDNPLDAIVWERVRDEEPGWTSPWGRGRPGWHAECTAMALATLGSGIDVHVGGADLAFPHHAFEAAQAEAAIGVHPFARSWLRVGTVMVNGEKMAKSAGNLVMVHELLENWSADTIRLMLLYRQWAEPWEFTAAALDQAAGRLEDLWRAGGRQSASVASENELRRALLKDLDVPRAVAAAEDAGGRAVRVLAGLLGLT